MFKNSINAVKLGLFTLRCVALHGSEDVWPVLLTQFPFNTASVSSMALNGMPRRRLKINISRFASNFGAFYAMANEASKRNPVNSGDDWFRGFLLSVYCCIIHFPLAFVNQPKMLVVSEHYHCQHSFEQKGKRFGGECRVRWSGKINSSREMWSRRLVGPLSSASE